MFDFLFPIIAHAQSTTSPSIKTLIWKISENILNPLIKLGFILALLYFIWGVVQYIRDKDAGYVWEATMYEKRKRTQGGADHIVWGLFGLFIMVSAFSIMAILRDVIGSDIVTP